jgi:purine-nucleoside/S-methyl-5'-thioadenosine phosphorylase / adenosine deaminase
VGDLNLGFTPGARRARVEQNRRAFVGRLRAHGFRLAEVRQIHSALAYRVTRGEDNGLEYLPCGYPPPSKNRGDLPQGDALITNEPGILLAVRSADCVPVLLADPDNRAVAAVHAGWKGMLEGIVEKTVGEMRRIFGTQPRSVVAAIGPSIRACCYEVGEEVESAFCGRFPKGEAFFPKRADEKAPAERNPYPPSFLSMAPPGHGPDPTRRPHLDLVAAARYQLQRSGLRAPNIRTGDLCTSCHTDLFFSYRKEGSRTGRMMAVIGVRPIDRPRNFRAGSSLKTTAGRRASA